MSTRYFTGYSIYLFLSQTAPISADMFRAYNSYDCQTSQSMMDISESSPYTELDKSAFENSNSDEYEYTCGSVYDYTVQNLDGQDVCLREYA